MSGGRWSGTTSVETRVAVLVAAAAVAAAGCGVQRSAAPPAATTQERAAAPAPRRCLSGATRSLDGARFAYAAVAPAGAVAYRRPGGRVVARFGAVNVNDYPTVFRAIGVALAGDCRPRWYRVQLPLRPNGAVGWVRAGAVRLHRIDARIVVDLSARRLTLYRRGRRAWSATVAVGSPSTPTPTGRFYVNQRLLPEDPGGPFGPAAIGISAFSNVLTGWTQGGPVAIHGTNEPWSIGRAVSNGCIRLPNATLERLFRVAVAGTPVVIEA